MFSISAISAVKQNSRKALGGSWGKATTIVLISVAAAMLIVAVAKGVGMVVQGSGYRDFAGTPGNYLDDFIGIGLLYIVINLVLLLVKCLTLLPLKQGVRSWYFALTKGESKGVKSVLAFFSPKLFLRFVAMSLVLLVYRTFYLMLFAVPSVLMFMLAQVQSEQGRSTVYAATLILSVVGYVLYLLFMNRYFLAPYYLTDEKLSPMQAVHLSVRHTRGFKLRIALAALSFAGWAVLCLAVVPLVYAVPYYSTTMAMYARCIMEYVKRRKGSFAELALSDEV